MSSPDIKNIPEDVPFEYRPTTKDGQDLVEITEQVNEGDIELSEWEEDFVDSLQMAIEEDRPWTQKQAEKFDELKEKYLDTQSG
jgi:hypothetical protein